MTSAGTATQTALIDQQPVCSQHRIEYTHTGDQSELEEDDERDPTGTGTDESQWHGPTCSTRMAIKGNASKACHVPMALAKYAVHSRAKCRPSECLAAIRGEYATMLSYVYFGTNNLQAAIEFYGAALAPLQMQRCITNDPDWDRVAAGWGIYEDGGARELAFWIGTPFDQKPATVGNGSMVAFSARSRKAVDDFYAAALANGGRCAGPPGLRLHYAADFYAAYVRDPDGNKVAAVCRGFTG